MTDRISHSEIESFQQCERKHYYGYGLKIQRRETSTAMATGTYGHSILEIFFKELKEGSDFDSAQQHVMVLLAQAITENNTFAMDLLPIFIEFFKNYPFKGWRVLAIEQELNMKIGDDFEAPGFADLVIQDVDGNIWILDHKFQGQLMSERDTELMPQLIKYMAAARQAGFRVDRVGYMAFRSKVTKSGVNLKFIPVPLTPARIQRTVDEQVVLSKRALAHKKLPLVEMAQVSMRVQSKFICNSCSFRSLCVAELNDTNPQLVLDSEYKPKEQRV